jgi:hypothetical protein
MAETIGYPHEMNPRRINLNIIPCGLTNETECLIYKTRLKFIIESLESEKMFYSKILGILDDPKSFEKLS